jgi:WD40 repeat protein
MRKVGLLIRLLVTLFAVMPVGAQEQVLWGACHYTRGAYYQPDIFPRYESRNQRLVLQSWTTGEVVQEIETSLNASSFTVVEWSPDCRYLVALVGGQGTVIWDVPNSTRMGVFPESTTSWNLHWDPSLTYVVMEKRRGVILWNISTNQQIELTEEYPSFAYFDWNLEEGQLIGTRWGGSQAVYDLQTGAQLGDPSSIPVDVPGGRFAFASANAYYGCIFSYRLDFYQPTNVHPRYNYRAKAFLLEGRVGGQRDQVIETSLDTNYFNILGWSPNCEYVAAALDFEHNGQIVVWDAVNSRRVATIAGGEALTERVHWDPTNRYLVVETWTGGYLLELSSGNLTLVNETITRDGQSFHRVGWDTVRGQLLAVQIGSGNGVTAYTLPALEQVGYFPTATEAAPVNFVLSADRSKIVVFTSERERVYDDRPSGLTVWDRDTLTASHLNPGTFAAGQAGQVTLSADNHYLVIARDDIRVWDLTRLPDAVENRLPVYQYDGPDGRVGYVRFLDERTLETQNVVFSPGGFYLHWDLHTGEFLNTYDPARDTVMSG